MPLQSSNTTLATEAFTLIRQNAAAYKAQAQNALTFMAANSVDSNFIFRMLDQLNAAISALTTLKATSGLDTFATSQGYPSTMSADCVATITAAQNCIAWVVANFPASGGFLQAETLNADGSRTARSFTTTQTNGLQTNLTSFISTIT